MATIGQIIAAGEASPQEIRNIQTAREKQRREFGRFNDVKKSIKQAVSKVNPNPELDFQEVTEWHRQVAHAFMREATAVDPDTLLDTEVIPVSVARLRAMAEKFANQALEIAANDTRVGNMRRDLAGKVDERLSKIGTDILRKLSPMLADATNVARAMVAEIYNRT